MKKALLIGFLLLPLVTGCGFFSKKVYTPEVPDKTIYVAPVLLESCDPLPLLQVTDTTDVLVAIHGLEIVKMYGICKQKQEASIVAIKRLANIKDQK